MVELRLLASSPSHKFDIVLSPTSPIKSPEQAMPWSESALGLPAPAFEATTSPRSKAVIRFLTKKRLLKGETLLLDRMEDDMLFVEQPRDILKQKCQQSAK